MDTQNSLLAKLQDPEIQKQIVAQAIASGTMPPSDREIAALSPKPSKPKKYATPEQTLGALLAAQASVQQPPLLVQPQGQPRPNLGNMLAGV